MSKRLLVGIGLLTIAAVILVVAQMTTNSGDKDDSETIEIATVKGFVGGEKVGFLDNPDIQKLLADRYQIKVDYTKLGSIEMIEADSSGQDFLWPSNEVALQLYRDTHPGTVKAETVFNSPIVLYSWDEVTDALITEGIVEQVDNTYYVVDMPRLVDLILTGQSWSDIGLSQLNGKINVISTDPTKSNSGNMFFGLLANLLSDGIATDTTIEEVLPTIKAYYDSLGFLQESSGDLFKLFTQQGMGAYPIIVGYESQLVELSLQNVATRDQILARLRVLYPQPTVWSSHPVIALNANGEKLMNALQDPDIQRMAWEQHGFRSGIAGIENDPAVFNVVGIPLEITSVLPLPRPSTMSRLVEYLEG